MQPGFLRRAPKKYIPMLMRKEHQQPTQKERRPPKTAANNPFENLSPKEIYTLLTDPSNDLPTWPGEDIQARYNSMAGPGVIRRTRLFIKVLERDGAFKEGWRGLDYGAGYGRIAALLLSKGTPDQVDLVDAFPKSLSYIEEGGFKNRYWLVPRILGERAIPKDTYTFVYAWSVFTHLAQRAFWNNLHRLKESVKAGGSLYFTVRHEDWAYHAYRRRRDKMIDALEKRDKMIDALQSGGFWFKPQRGALGPKAVYGDAIVSKERLLSELGQLGQLDYLGTPRNRHQHLYALRIKGK
jgi:SAM-dependent methyltransferase